MSAGRAAAEIEHVFVLMLENRSYDHMLGSAGGACGPVLTARDGCLLDPTNTQSAFVPASPAAPDRVDPDPPHEFHDVRFQLTGDETTPYTPGMRLPGTGYAGSARRGQLFPARATAAASSGKHALECQSGKHTPMLRFLAQNYVVCRRWFSSMPGPTWPNRFFAHAATSGGLDNSPSRSNAFWFTVRSKLRFDFPGGTVFKALGPDRWCVYHGDVLPQVVALKDAASQYFYGNFRLLSDLARDLSEGRAMPPYVFIEPTHNVLREGYYGNSQHPVGKVSAGDHLLEVVYNALRASPFWRRSLLIVTYDEHGGFFDRCEPPVATPPGDGFAYRARAQFPGNFGFDRLGVRVPALVVSPWVESVPDDTLYDHGTIVKTLGELFDFGPLTARDRDAASLTTLLTRETPRISEQDAPLTRFYGDLPLQPPELLSNEQIDELGRGREGDSEDLTSGNVAGFFNIALLIDDELKRRRATPSPLRSFVEALAGDFLPVALPPVRTRRQALQYIAQVERRVLEARLERQLGV